MEAPGAQAGEGNVYQNNFDMESGPPQPCGGRSKQDELFLEKIPYGVQPSPTLWWKYDDFLGSETIWRRWGRETGSEAKKEEQHRGREKE